jgi:EAL domain-containing protein (putative c-di-GMP-specific phosphodiesterase class I)
MLALSRSVGAQTIAEGVETPALARLMEQPGCAYGQGWLFGKPARLPEVGTGVIAGGEQGRGYERQA